MVKRSIILVVLLLGTYLLSACSEEDIMMSLEKNREFENTEQDDLDKSEFKSSDFEDEFVDINSTLDESKKDRNDKSKSMIVAVYISDKSAKTLKKEIRKIYVEDDNVAWSMVKALKDTPHEEAYYSTVPDNIEFKGIVVKDGLAIVNIDNNNVLLGMAEESLFIESIVLTLIRLPSIDRVKITLRGEEVDTIGHKDLREELTSSSVTYSEVLD